MKPTTLTVFLSALFVLGLLASDAHAGSSHLSQDQAVRQLLSARDDDDREDAAKRLGDIGNVHALKALEFAASYDKEDDVRKAAGKAARKVRDRLLAQQQIQRYRHPDGKDSTAIVIKPAEPVAHHCPPTNCAHHKPAAPAVRAQCHHRHTGPCPCPHGQPRHGCTHCRAGHRAAPASHPPVIIVTPPPQPSYSGHGQGCGGHASPSSGYGYRYESWEQGPHGQSSYRHERYDSRNHLRMRWSRILGR